MNIKLKKYIKENLKEYNRETKAKRIAFARMANSFCGDEQALESSINNYININKTENKFQTLLFKYIDKKGLKDSDVYNKVHIDRRLFSKIRSDVNYHPSKETVILLGISLELNENEIEELLESASYSLPKNNYYDLIIRFCFKEKIYDLKTINDFLDEYKQKMFSY